MMQREKFPIVNIYVPVKRRATLVQKRVDELAESMLKDGQTTQYTTATDKVTGEVTKVEVTLTLVK